MMGLESSPSCNVASGNKPNHGAYRKSKRTFPIHRLQNRCEEPRITVEQLVEPNESYNDFTNSLPLENCGYAVFDFDYITEETCQISKIYFISWETAHALPVVHVSYRGRNLCLVSRSGQNNTTRGGRNVPCSAALPASKPLTWHLIPPSDRVYDVTRRESFSNLSEVWAKEVELHCTNQDCVKMLVGNKVDKMKENPLQLKCKVARGKGEGSSFDGDEAKGHEDFENGKNVIGLVFADVEMHLKGLKQVDYRPHVLEVNGDDDIKGAGIISTSATLLPQQAKPWCLSVKKLAVHFEFDQEIEEDLPDTSAFKNRCKEPWTTLSSLGT
ncbi:hypothetical protein HPP92_002440 [Vanilla planifolia]|uniref:ADF-H domain-containing protein n=1 Tax=Vanilla planifolia TaxID=51239 RepID=A0A835RTF0_VANPL|nr:hypothetical protein HPP92_002440 [Vanilla planifolia]